MKKTLLTMAAALALVGCARENLLPNGYETVADGKVGANIFVPATTRGAALNTADDLIGSQKGFDLISYYNLEGTYTEFMGTSDDGIEFKHDGSAWDYADRGEIHFWQAVPDDATDMKFFAVSPAKEYLPNEGVTSDGSTSYSIGADAQTITYTVPTTVSEQVDLMFAQTDLADGDYEPTSEVYRNGVPLNFHHALSQIVFKARIADKEDTDLDGTSDHVTAYVNSISVKNVHGTGTFDMAAASAILGATEYWDGGLEGMDYDNTLWTPSDGATNGYTVSDLTNHENITWIAAEDLTDGAIGTETAMLLLPQQLNALDLSGIGTDVNSANEEQITSAGIDLTSAGAYLEVNCRVEYTDKDGVVTYIVGEDADSYANIYIPISTNWQPGYKYVYTLIFSADSGDPVKAYVDTVDEWNTAEGEDAPNSGDNDDTDDSNEPGTSEDNPIMLASIDDLYNLAEEVNNGDDKAGQYFAVPHEGYGEFGIITLENWVPIGKESAPFKGCFIGNYANIQIQSFGETKNEYEELIGLFGYVGEGGRLERVGVVAASEDMIITSDKDELYFGLIVAKNEGEVSACTSDFQKITINHDNAYVGGLVGENASGGIISSARVVGMEGITTNGEKIQVGGIAGSAGYSTIMNCRYMGEITNNSTDDAQATGGIVGHIGGSTIANCASYCRDEYEVNGTTKGNMNVGGIVGCIGYNSKIYVCCNANTVEGNKNVGGIVGESWVTEIHACYNVGKISAEAATAGIGQIVGYDDLYVRDMTEEVLGTSSFFANYYKEDNTIAGVGEETGTSSTDVTNESEPTIGTQKVTAATWGEWAEIRDALNSYINSISSKVEEESNGIVWVSTYKTDEILEDSILPFTVMSEF